jgi:hypothetical protein
MQADSTPVAPRSPMVRSRIGNGSALLPNVEGRSVWVRLMKEGLLAHCGGEEAASET